VKTGTELGRVLPSWTEYTDDLGLCQMLTQIQTKSEVFRAEPESLLAQLQLRSVFHCVLQHHTEGFRRFSFQQIHIILLFWSVHVRVHLVVSACTETVPPSPLLVISTSIFAMS
jgi:hypothetical protein